MRDQNQSNKWLVRSIVLMVLIIISVFGYAVSKELNRKKQIEAQIDSLRQESDRIKRENMEFGEKIEYLASKDYQEIEAKDKLNLKSPDEKMVVISQSPSEKQETSPQTASSPRPAADQVPNYRKWWKYFFN